MTPSNITQGTNLWSKSDLADLANRATFALLGQDYLQITHPSNKKPEGFPLPVKKNQPSGDGTLTQDYRPIAVLEYVHDVLSAEVVANRFRAIAI